MLVHCFTLVLCITLFVCIAYFIFSCSNESCFTVLYLKRLVFAAIVSTTVAFWGIKKKSLDWTGAISGFIVGLILTFSSYCFLACLLTFFLTSSKATHFGATKKKKFEADFKEGGQRNWIQVICNGGVAVQAALLYVLEGGVGECPLDLDNHPQRSWLALAVLSALAGVNGDTWASELGTVLSRTEPRLITTFRKVPIGTNGGFTMSGLFYSASGGFVIGIAYFVALLLTEVVENRVKQAVLFILIGLFAGIFGSLLDSVVGATLQYSGREAHSGKIVEQPGVGIQHISGYPLLTNHSVNLVMSLLNAIVVPTFILKLHTTFFR